ncbi:MAG: peroxiredoxin [Proteobacteria bacterium]|nr:MAG: peroxiredoxin [Pseudomonadota bacterium]
MALKSSIIKITLTYMLLLNNVHNGISDTPNIPLKPTPTQIVIEDISEGRQLKSLDLVASSGQKLSSEKLRSKKCLLITFFPKCFTGNCTSQLTSIRDSYSDFQKAGIEVWAVSTDPAEGPQGQKAFAKFLKLPFPLIPDTDRKISKMFGAVQSEKQMALRMSVFVDKEGVVRWIDKQIDPRNHARDVLARYKAEIAVPKVEKEAQTTSENTRPPK